MIMKTLTRHALASVTALIAASVLSSRTEAQMTTVSVTLKVPFTAQNLSPQIERIMFFCPMRSATGAYEVRAGEGSSGTMLGGFPKDANGTISGILTATFQVIVPVNAGGTQVQYDCTFRGRAGGSTATDVDFRTDAADLRYRVASPTNVTGTFTW